MERVERKETQTERKVEPKEGEKPVVKERTEERIPEEALRYKLIFGP